MSDEPTSFGIWARIFGGGLGLGAAIGGYVWAVAKELLPNHREVARRIRSRFVRAASGTHFTVLIADLDGDGSGCKDHV